MLKVQDSPVWADDPAIQYAIQYSDELSTKPRCGLSGFCDIMGICKDSILVFRCWLFPIRTDSPTGTNPRPSIQLLAEDDRPI